MDWTPAAIAKLYNRLAVGHLYRLYFTSGLSEFQATWEESPELGWIININLVELSDLNRNYLETRLISPKREADEL